VPIARFDTPVQPIYVINSLNDLFPDGFPLSEPQGLVLYEEELE
jgi:hypothetical protein